MLDPNSMPSWVLYLLGYCTSSSIGATDHQWSGSYQHVQLRQALLTTLNSWSIHNVPLLYPVVCVPPLLRT